ncbi:MAG: prepilin-type N-terminal cleavage/methylation domain-containing protein, partial [Verrucomicrobiota bacterium]|nr:prepilin-type N-terminal cleavage/methylation domain-containing protein [Verrucomicrobiota bacterium]
MRSAQLRAPFITIGRARRPCRAESIAAHRDASPCRNNKSQGGFTILEVMMAAFVMALVLATSLIVIQRGFQAIDTARYTTLAGQIL